MSFSHRKRVLIGKIGLDLHDRGVKLIAQALRDAGMEVIYLGTRKTPEEMVEAAVQEDIDIMGLGFHSGSHNVLISRVIALLKEKSMANLPVIIGGIIPSQDVAGLKEMGIKEVFGPGTSLQAIVNCFLEAN